MSRDGWAPSATVLTAALTAVAVSWPLGLEQVVPPAVLVGAVAVGSLTGGLRPNVFVALYAAFLLSTLPSMAALSGRAEWLVYLRGLFNLAGGFAAFWLASEVRPSSRGAERLARAAAVFLVVVGVVGAAVGLGWLPLRFTAPVGVLLEPLAASDFVRESLIEKQIGGTAPGAVMPGLPRLSAFFLFQGGLASALIVLLTVVVVHWPRYAGRWRTWALAGLSTGFACLAMTRSRVGIAGAALGFGAVGVWRLLEGRAWRRTAFRVVAAGVLVVGVLAVVPFGVPALWERVFVQVRPGSFVDRLDVYLATLSRVAERPWFGWGVQEMATGSATKLRLGTHSEVLNVLYRFGWAGVGTSVLLWGAVAGAWARRFVAVAGTGDDRRLDALFALGAGAVVLTGNALVRGMQWDANVYWLAAALGGAVVAHARPSVRRPARAARPFEVLGARIDPLTQGELTDLVERSIAAAGQTVVGHHNLHSLYLLGRDEGFDRFARRADHAHVDGMGVVLAGRLLGVPLRREHRVTYADWIDPLMRRAARRGWRVFHLGGRPGVGERAAEILRRRHPGLDIAGRHGYFDAGSGSADTAEALAAIEAHDPQLLLVGMGMPRQERWIAENLDRIRASVILVSGACMDYVAGEIPTPPRWAGRAGLEWLFRLAAEPRRLARRYLWEPWFVAARVARERWRRGSGPSS